MLLFTIVDMVQSVTAVVRICYLFLYFVEEFYYLYVCVDFVILNVLVIALKFHLVKILCKF